jgi:hypothetical protein
VSIDAVSGLYPTGGEIGSPTNFVDTLVVGIVAYLSDILGHPRCSGIFTLFLPILSALGDTRQKSPVVT